MSQDGAAGRRSYRILWIEDDYYHLKGLVKPLQKMGFKIATARSFVEARKSLQDWQQFCMIILDLILPYSETERVSRGQAGGNGIADMTENGVGLFDHMVDELRLTIPILILSVVTDEHIINHVVSKGAVRPFVKRGVLPEELKAAVMEILGQSGGEGTAGDNHTEE